jgi:hypothetical protein
MDVTQVTPAVDNFKKGMIMKTKGKAFWTVLSVSALMAFVAGCATTQTAPDQQGNSFLGSYYKDLAPGPEGGAKMRWLKPGVNFAKYNKVMLDSIVFFFAEDSDYKGMDPYALKELGDGFNQQFVNALKDTYPVVSEPGPDVVRIRIAVTDLKASKPGLSAISSVVPAGLGISIIKKGASGSWAGSGATSAEFMAIDSMTGAVIAVAQDERSAGFTERFSKWGSAEDAFKFWGERVKLVMDSFHKSKQ